LLPIFLIQNNPFSFLDVTQRMNKTVFVVTLFISALLAGLFVRYLMTTASPITRSKDEESESESEGKENFAQRQVGMPLDMQAVEGSVGVAGYNGTPPLLGSEPKPVPERPYDMANDTELFMFANNKISADCCPSPFSADGGCVCLTDNQMALFASRGGNRSMI
jgi:hypothetical protein